MSNRGCTSIDGMTLFAAFTVEYFSAAAVIERRPPPVLTEANEPKSIWIASGPVT